MFLIDFTLEIDAENEKNALRLAHKLAELLLDEWYVIGIEGDPPREGQLGYDPNAN